MTRPQFRPTTRPLRPISYRRAARRFRQLADLIERMRATRWAIRWLTDIYGDPARGFAGGHLAT